MRADSEIHIVATTSTSPVARELIDELTDVLAARYGSGGRDGFQPTDEKSVLFLVAFHNNHPVGCGAVRSLSGNESIGEIKRMYSRPGTVGVGRRILAALEAHALKQGFESVCLETRRANTNAVRFYEKAGYQERAPYGKYRGRPEAICMEKNLTRINNPTA